MSYYDCDCCGRNSVDQPGEWCSECQKKEYMEFLKWEGIWYASSRLCHQCGNAWGPDPSDKCSAYNMPLYMVKRKNKCKRFTKINLNICEV